MLRSGDGEPVEQEEIDLIRRLCDFDLMGLIYEIDEHGWSVARVTLRMIAQSGERLKDPV
jgi:hypothetical protein